MNEPPARRRRRLPPRLRLRPRRRRLAAVGSWGEPGTTPVRRRYLCPPPLARMGGAVSIQHHLTAAPCLWGVGNGEWPFAAGSRLTKSLQIGGLSSSRVRFPLFIRTCSFSNLRFWTKCLRIQFLFGFRIIIFATCRVLSLSVEDTWFIDDSILQGFQIHCPHSFSWEEINTVSLTFLVQSAWYKFTFWAVILSSGTCSFHPVVRVASWIPEAETFFPGMFLKLDKAKCSTPECCFTMIVILHAGHMIIVILSRWP